MGAISTEPVWCSCRLVRGVGGEVGEFGQGQVDLDHAAAGLPVLDVFDEVVREVRAAHVVQERGARVQASDDDLGGELLAVVQLDAGGAAVADQDLDYFRAGADLGAVLSRRVGDGVGDGAHAALLEAPVAQVPVADVADRMVRHHVGGAGLVRAGPGADHAVDRERALDLRRLEPVVEQVGDRHGHKPGHVGDRAHVEVLVAPGQPEGLLEIVRLVRAEVRRDGEQHRAEHLGQAGQPGVPARHRVSVLLRPAGHLVVVALGVVGVELYRPALGKGLVVRAHREDLVPVPGELEVLDDGRRQQRHHVGQAGDVELGCVRPRGFGRRGAAGLVPGLEHQGAGPRAGQVRRRDQPVVPAADDDRVVVRGLGSPLRPGRAGRLGCLRSHEPGPPKD